MERDSFPFQIFPPDASLDKKANDYNWPKIEETLIFMGADCLGEVTDVNSLPEEISLEAKEMLLEDGPVKIFSFPNDVRIYLGSLEKNSKTISVAIFKGKKYVGYDHDYDVTGFLQNILYLTGELKLRTIQKEKKDEIIN